MDFLREDFSPMVLRPLATCLHRLRLFPSAFRYHRSTLAVCGSSSSAAIKSSSMSKSEMAAVKSEAVQAKPASPKTSSSQPPKDSSSASPGKEKEKKSPATPPSGGDKGGGGGGSGVAEECDVLFSTCGYKALIILNRPKQMNALNHCMSRKISFMLNKWKCDKTVIVVKGFGHKAFCAGGDVVSIAKDSTGVMGKNFFRDEYKLNATIGCLKVPYVSIYNGIVMGGGVGLSIHGKYRVATECSVFAMPETQIGFFPDVGVSHFLSRMPNNLGVFLGLTGYRIKSYDLIHVGIATHFCTSSKLQDLEKDLLDGENKKSVDEILRQYHEESVKSLCNSEVPLFTLEEDMPVIINCFCGDCMEVIMQKLEVDPCPLSKELLATLKKCSPLALKVSLKQIREACSYDLYNCLNIDYRIASRFMEGKDFFEGVRALLIDKDKKPKWQHECLTQVTDEEVCSYFAELPHHEELNLPLSLEC